MAEEWGDWPIDDDNTQLVDLHPFWDHERQHQRCQAAYRQLIDASFCTSGRCPHPDVRLGNVLLPWPLTPTDVASLVQEYSTGCISPSLCALDPAWSSRLHTQVQAFLGRGGVHNCALQLRCIWLGGATLLPATGYAAVYVLLRPERDVWQLLYKSIRTTHYVASTCTGAVPWLCMYIRPLEDDFLEVRKASSRLDRQLLI
ncbi:hypothetical protein SDRG_13529 [Saprolegnia diclina VS20]|uniref:Uncharacterized protein n=1 Tax=Saprolegnia diclina (strain VS20) TaxID=1156394 RepID=T0RG39_SAPDV|nr:hypothetical protein SDRG_13529 [Saprolegnia diclina VS20]EQC28652.1 hypothetical protein SDRG_13529 [Saprolegnia diclina VS20]|eukprot:XP_008617844.1 hypothetical protein SDRG_13529 [Saprolegnia diclina VS20]